MYGEAALRGIEIGRKCRFFGRLHLRRSRHTRIKIGTACTFRSSLHSNLMGLNHPCMLSTFYDNAFLEIGDRVGMSGTVIGAREHVKIGHDVMCGGNTFITDYDWHPIHPELRRQSHLAPSAPTIIEDNVWLGMNVVVLKGVTIGRNTVIGANSVVATDIPANVIAAGNPAKVLRPLDA